MPAKCPACAYENADEALCCNLCQAVLRKEKKVEPPEESAALDSPDAVKRLLKYVLRLGNEAAKSGNKEVLNKEVPRLAGRLFLEVPPDQCRALVLEPTVANYLQIAAPAFFKPQLHAELKAALEKMCAAAQERRFGDAADLLRAAEKAGSSQWGTDLLILGLGLKRASEKTEAARLMISDFGLAAAIQDGKNAKGAAMGTPIYMPPEQFLGVDRCDHRSDIYSFGVVLFQLAARGKVPFWFNDRQGFWDGMRRLHCEAPVPKLETPLFPIISRCLEKQPLERYQSFRLLRCELEVLLKRQTGEDAPAPELKRRDWYGWDAKGTSLSLLGRYQEALPCYEKSLELEPTSLSWNNKGAALMRLKRYEESLGCFEKAISLEDSVLPWSNKAAALRKLGRDQDALTAIEAALKRGPQDYDAWSVMGSILYALGRYEESGRAFDQAIAIDETEEDAWSKKAVVLQDLGRFEDSLAAADKALSINPGSADAWNNKGRGMACLKRHEEALACKELGRHGEASAALERELELDPENGSTWLEKGRAHVEAKRWQEALPFIEKAAQLEPQWPLAWNNKGLCLWNLGRLEEAQAAYGRCLELNPLYISAALSRGDILLKLSRYAEAIDLFDKAIAAGPEKSSPARIGAAWYYKGVCLHHLGQLAEAEPCYLKAAELLPENARPAATAALQDCRGGLPPPRQ